MQNSEEHLLQYENEKHVHALFERMIRALIIKRPEDPIEFLIEALTTGDIPDKFELERPQAFTIDI